MVDLGDFKGRAVFSEEVMFQIMHHLLLLHEEREREREGGTINQIRSIWEVELRCGGLLPHHSVVQARRRRQQRRRRRNSANESSWRPGARRSRFSHTLLTPDVSHDPGLLPSAPHGTVCPAWYRLPCMVPSAGPVYIGPRLHAAALFRGCASEMLCLPMQAANLRCGVMVARHIRTTVN